MNVPCNCSKCFPVRYLALRTVKNHLKDDITTLLTFNHTSDYAAHLQKCIDRNRETLQDLEPGQRAEAGDTSAQQMDIGTQF